MNVKTFLEVVEKVCPGIQILDREEDRLVYSHGAYPLEYKWILQGKYKYLPSAIIVADSTTVISQVVKLANKHDVGLIPYGGGSGIVGGTKADHGQVMIDTKLLRNFSINHKNMTVTAGAGWTGAELENELNHYGYTSGHYPQSFQSAVVGGMVATRAIGTFSTKYGKMDDIVTALEVVLPNGDILQTHRAPKRSTGPELMELFLGSEGVYGIITEATMKIYPIPEKRVFEAFTFPSTSNGLEAIRNILRKGVNPAVVRLYDEVEATHRIELMGGEKDRALLYLGYEGFTEMVDLEQKIANRICLAHGATYHGLEAGEQWFKTRFSTKKMQDYDATRGGTADAIEVAAPWDCIENVWRSMREALEPMTEVVDCHFSHVYHSGASVYVIFHAKTGMDDVEGAKRYRQCLKTAVETSIANGGNVSHHHGVGTAKAEFLVDEHGDAGMKVMKQIKDALDPKGLMNKGVLGL